MNKSLTLNLRPFLLKRPFRGLIPACLFAVLVSDVDAEKAEAFCRFVPERMDDFAWENDRVAFRMYGPALWEDPAKRCGSGVDVWVKKVRYPIIDKWMKERRKGGKYHIDEGEGADLYKVGKTLGCGGLGYWLDGKLQLNRHFATQKVLTGSGPEIEFELTYEPLEVAGKSVTETKRIRMKTGTSFYEVHNTFGIEGGGSVDVAVGIVREKGKDAVVHGDNWIAYAGPETEKNGQTYCGVILPGPAKFLKTKDHVLLVTKVKDGDTLTYRSGAAWNRGLDFKSATEWNAYVKSEASPKTALGEAVTIEKPEVVFYEPVDPDKGATSKFFADWPKGKDPATIGKKVSENFLSRGHYKDHPQLRYPGVVTWFGALKLARETADNELAAKLISRYDR